MCLIDQLIEDLDWRIKELAILKILLSQTTRSANQQRVILRACWPLLYAHFEGFTKTAITIFFDTIQKQGIKNSSLPNGTQTLVLKKEIKELRKCADNDFMKKFANFSSNLENICVKIPEITTNSNLNTSTLAGLLKEADMKDEFIKIKNYEINNLVNRRNNIAHGENEYISDPENFKYVAKKIEGFMYDLAQAICDRTEEVPFGPSVK